MQARSKGARLFVLLAAFEGRRWISDQIDIILSQRGIDVHLLVYDDTSRDGTWAELVTRHGNDPWVTLTRSAASSGSAERTLKTSSSRRSLHE